MEIVPDAVSNGATHAVARIVAEACPACEETFYPDQPGTGQRCTRCTYYGITPLPPLSRRTDGGQR